jgi:perosamine synthetase
MLAPLHLQLFHRARLRFRPGDLPITERAAASTLALPLSSRLVVEEVRYVANTLVEAVDAES